MANQESKQEKIIREMFTDMNEHFIRLEALSEDPSDQKLTEWAKSFIMNCLGFNQSNGYTLHSDQLIYQEASPLLFICVQPIGTGLGPKFFEKLTSKVPYGMLTNGFEWRLFDLSLPAQPSEIICCELPRPYSGLDLENESLMTATKNFFLFHEINYRALWSSFARESATISRVKLAKAILSPEVIELISKDVFGNNIHTTTNDVLAHKIFNLLTTGMGKEIEVIRSLLADQLKAARTLELSKGKSGEESSESLDLEEVEFGERVQVLD